MKRRDSPSAQESPMNRTEVDITFITTTTSCFPSISNILFCDIITDKRIIKSCKMATTSLQVPVINKRSIEVAQFKRPHHN